MNLNDPDNNVQSLEPLLLRAGKILFLFQQLENILELCCTFLEVVGIQIKVDDLFLNETDKRNYTLGQMIGGMKKSKYFKSSFEERLDKFVKMRNTFVHNYWVKNHIHALNELVDQTAFKEILSYEENLHSETLYVLQVFLGFSYSIGHEIASREGKTKEFESDLEYDDMKQYQPQFLSVVDDEGI